MLSAISTSDDAEAHRIQNFQNILVGLRGSGLYDLLRLSIVHFRRPHSWSLMTEYTVITWHVGRAGLQPRRTRQPGGLGL